jgi:hypothetical protein
MSLDFSRHWRLLLTILLVTVGLILLVVFGGLGLFFRSLDALSATPEPPPLLQSAALQGTRTPTPTMTPTPTPAPTNPLALAAPALVAAPVAYALPPAPDEGAVYDLPAEPQRVGWVSQAADGAMTASFPDFAMYAGYLDEVDYVGVASFVLPSFDEYGLTQAADLLLFGLTAENQTLADGIWTVEMLADGELFWREPSAAALARETTRFQVATLAAAELAPGQMARIPLGQEVVDYLNALRYQKRPLTLRIVGPGAGEKSLFGFDGGIGSGSLGNPPRLLLSTGPVRPTPAPIIVTATPTPQNVLTADAQIWRITAEALLTGTATPTPFIVFTATPGGADGPEMVMVDGESLPVIVPTETPANAATAEMHSRFATAMARTTGTATPLPERYVTATPTRTPIYLLATPTPENPMTRVAELMTATAVGTATPLPDGYLIVTATPAFIVVTNTPVPENAATAEMQAAQATLNAFLTGTPSLPIVTATFTPSTTPVPLVIPESQLTPTPTATLTPTPPAVLPDIFRNRVVFLSDRGGKEELYALDPVTGESFNITQRWPYDLARQRLDLSPDGNKRAIVAADDNRHLQIQVYSLEYGDTRSITNFTNATSYDPAWSPTGEWIAFVSTEAGNDEIYIARPDGSEIRRLTNNSWEWDKHPSWSPDGQQLVFWSNRESGRSQIWIMNWDGSNPRNLTNSLYNDWAPIWIP